MFSPENPWIREREAALCTWKFDMNRGYVGNTSVSLLNDFMCLSDRQLRDYARMIKACGFTGIQVMDICAAWRAMFWSISTSMWYRLRCVRRLSSLMLFSAIESIGLMAD